MPRKKVIFDDDNPEWTEQDFREAKPASSLPPEILKHFPKTRQPKKPRTKAIGMSRKKSVDR